MYESTDKMVSHPNHYQSKYGFEVIDVIEEYTQELYGICATDTGNMIKYICRWKQKNGIQDLEKAIWYATHIKEKSAALKYYGRRLIEPKIFMGDVIKAYTDGLDPEEELLTSRALCIACDWWLFSDRIYRLSEFIKTIEELIKYEKEKENTHEN